MAGTLKNSNGHPDVGISDHGLIGDLRTAALVATDGAVDFLCWPRFDSPSVFARLLDAAGGAFELAPDYANDPATRRQQLYLPSTNVLVTRFLSAGSVTEITDLMPVGTADAAAGTQRLVRIASCVRGTARFRLRCAPRFDYARRAHRAELVENDEAPVLVRFEADGSGDETNGQDPAVPRAAWLRLAATQPLSLDGDDAIAEFELSAGMSTTFVLDGESGDAGFPRDLAAAGAGCFQETVTYWRRWIGKSTYRGRARESVERSALVLKLMTSAEHGSIVAAPTFGLPEALGGERNWDYRFTWLRDAAFTLYAFVRLGLTGEARNFMTWLYDRAEAGAHDGSLQIMYGLDGRALLPESELPHFGGYAGSRPVRVGNAAFDQLQLDSYGAMLDAVYLANKHAGRISYQGWLEIRRTVDWVCENWTQPDEGIWEFRGGRRHFLSSRLMCWVAVDRALRMAQKYSLPAPVDRWQAARNELYQSVHDDFWRADIGAFVQSKPERDKTGKYLGLATLDASCLLMPLMKFIAPDDPRWLSTLDAVGRVLSDDALVRRYDLEASREVDALSGEEGSFTVCSFWYVECLARAGRVDEARLLFDKLLSYANHLGLYAEELGPAGDHLGNFPQALTHLALISAATALTKAIDGGELEN